MRQTRYRFFAVVAAAVLGLGACTSDDGEEATASTDAAAPGGEDATPLTGACPDKGPATIGMSTPLPIDLFETYIDVVEDQAGRAGHEVIAAVANLDPNKQISDVQSMINQGVDVIIVAPLVPEAMQPVIARARDERIRVIGIDIGADLVDQYATNVVSLNRQAAQAAAEFLGEQVPGGTVTILNGPSFGGRPLIERAEGFEAGAAQAGLDVVDEQTNEAVNADTAAAIANTWKQQFPDLGGMLLFNDISAIGALSAVGGGFEPVVVSINGEVAAIEAVRAGRLTATYDLLPIAHGNLLAYAADQAFCGNDLPTEIGIETVRVDGSNVDRWTPLDEQRELSFTVEFEEREGETVLVIPPGFPFREDV